MRRGRNTMGVRRRQANNPSRLRRRIEHANVETVIPTPGTFAALLSGALKAIVTVLGK
jgi:hypothetical protein